MTKETMWRYVVLYAALAWLSVSGPVFAQEPSPPLGQIVGWKSFSVASTYYEMPAAAKATWFQTNFPETQLLSNNTRILDFWCFAMFDVVPAAFDVVNMAIVVDDFTMLFRLLGRQ